MSDPRNAYVVDFTARMATQKYRKVRIGQGIGSLLGVFFVRLLFVSQETDCTLSGADCGEEKAQTAQRPLGGFPKGGPSHPRQMRTSEKPLFLSGAIGSLWSFPVATSGPFSLVVRRLSIQRPLGRPPTLKPPGCQAFSTLASGSGFNGNSVRK
jgi:hypothetical protein